MRQSAAPERILAKVSVRDPEMIPYGRAAAKTQLLLRTSLYLVKPGRPSGPRP